MVAGRLVERISLLTRRFNSNNPIWSFLYKHIVVGSGSRISGKGVICLNVWGFALLILSHFS